MIAVIPDTQYYVDSASLSLHDHGGTLAMFQAQITWIKAHQADSNIVYVAGLGDITDHGDSTVRYPGEWEKANHMYSQLETPLTGLPNGIPYGLAVGNHDQNPYGKPITGTTTKYNANFGISRFTGRTYYGGYYGTNNDSHYDLFTAGGLNFIVIYIEYDSDTAGGEDTPGAVATWAYNLLGTYSTRKAIIVSHGIINNGQGWFDQGLRVYNRLKTRKNVFMMLCGHAAGKGAQRWDTYDGNTIKTFLSDYQINFYRPGYPTSSEDGGNGLMRLVKISVANDIIAVRTYSPYANLYITNKDTSDFTRPLFHHETAMRTCDFNKDGKTELSLFNAGVWKVEGLTDVSYGMAGDLPAPMDFNGDGRTDYCLFRPSDGTWHARNIFADAFGTSGDIPVPGDYDGDGKAEFAVFRPSLSRWYIYPSLSGTTYGTTGDIPVPGDYDGDGKVDLAIFRPSNSTWYIQNVLTYAYGTTSDIPTPGDYNGDGKVDVSVFRRSNHTWYISGQTTVTLTNYVTGDIPVPGDYDGDGNTDRALYRPSTGQFFVDDVLTTTIAGATTSFKPVNLPYSIRKFFFP